MEEDTSSGRILHESTGYWYISYKGALYASHRLVWEYFNGKIPDNLIIDHIDRERTNNSLDNLRVVTNHQNRTNQKIDKRNKSGHRGVRIRTKNGRMWVEVSWSCLNGKRVFKTVPCRGRSLEEAILEAVKIRNEALSLENSLGAIYELV